MVGLTSAQLVTLACQRAKIPGMVSQCGQYLNMILADLAQIYDFGLATTTYNFNFSVATVGQQGLVTNNPPIPAPADFLRVKPKGFFFIYNGVPYTLISIELDEYDALVLQGGIANFPEFFATDFETTPAQWFVWPPPNGAYPATVRYFKQPSDIVTPETSSIVPWFPNQRALLQALTALMMEQADDDRADDFQAKYEMALTKYLKNKDDPAGKAKLITLDRRQFGKSFNRLPNTKIIGW